MLGSRIVARTEQKHGRFAVCRASGVAALLAALCLATAAWGQCPSGGTCWIGGASGAWSNPANWSKGVPTSSTNALIDNHNANGQGASAVTLDIGAAQVLNLTIDSDDSLNFNDNTNLTVSGTSISNAHTISLNSVGNPTELVVGAPSVTLSGGGTLTLTDSANPQNIIAGASGTDTLVNKETIQGSGNIGNGSMGLINQGTILANGTHTLFIQPSSSGFTNNGTLQAASGSTLHVKGGPFTNFSGSTLKGGTYNASGTLEIDQLGGTGGEILTNTANIILSGAASSFVDAAGNNALSNLNTNATSGGFTITAGRNFTTTGNFTNSGTLTVDSSNSKFAVNGNLTNFNSLTNTLTGGTYNLTGTLQFNGANIVTNAASITLTGTSSQIIDQNGGNGLANFATNDVGGNFTVAGGRVFTTSGAFTNNGTLTVGSSNSTFTVNGNLTNFDSLTNTLNDGTYNLTGTLQFGGANIVTNTADITLTGTSSRIIDQNGANGLANFATNDFAGNFTVAGSRVFTTAGAFTNNGTLTVGSSNSTFAVNGSLTNFSGTTLTGGTYNLTGTLQFNGANIVTNAANITLTGTSSRIIDQNGANGLANFATNASSGNFALVGGRVVTTSGTFTNNGSLTTNGSGSMFTTGGSASFTNNGTLTTTGGAVETATGASASFTNNGTLTVGSGSTFSTGGSLTNFSGTTLTGGTYNVSGTFQFPGANIVTNAATIALTGTSSKILNSTNSANGLANFVVNASTGAFSLQNGRSLTTPGNFSNAGNFRIGSASTFTVGGSGMFTQTAGMTTDDGNLTLMSSGTLNLQGGSLLGSGTVTGAVTSSGTVTPGDVLIPGTTGILGEKGAYTQNSTGTLNILIKGTAAGAQYDQLNPTTATLSGTLNISLKAGFIPNIGSTFKIMNFNSESGTFAAVNGLAINTLEHFTIAYQPTDVLLTVAAGPCCGHLTKFSISSAIGPTYSAAEPSLLGVGRYARDGNLPHLALPSDAWSQEGPRVAASTETIRSRSMVDSSVGSKFATASAMGLGTRATPTPQERAGSGWVCSCLSQTSANYETVRQAVPLLSASRFQTIPRAYLDHGVIRAGELASMDSMMRQSALNRIATFVPARNFSVRASGGPLDKINPTAAPLHNNGHTPKMVAARRFEYHLDLLSLLGTGRRQALRDLWRQPENPNAGLGYLTISGSH